MQDSSLDIWQLHFELRHAKKCIMSWVIVIQSLCQKRKQSSEHDFFCWKDCHKIIGRPSYEATVAPNIYITTCYGRTDWSGLFSMTLPILCCKSLQEANWRSLTLVHLILRFTGRFVCLCNIPLFQLLVYILRERLWSQEAAGFITCIIQLLQTWGLSA